jgi:protein-S-isoprenylcysteine O-methyltransferase Ste14
VHASGLQQATREAAACTICRAIDTPFFPGAGIDRGKAASQINSVMRVACQLWIVSLWAAFLIFWLIAAISAKRSFDRGALRRGMAAGAALFGIMLAAVAFLVPRPADVQALLLLRVESDWMAVAGAILATVGAIVAFAARAVIGRNWGIPATRQTDTELVTGGPYKVIRHPIYSGILLMMVGTAIGLAPVLWLATVAVAVYFIASARAEEAYMARRFPDLYPGYRARTKMLIPFLL